MSSPLSPAQLDLLRLALAPGAPTLESGDPKDFAVLTRAGLLRDCGGGRYAATEAGRRYGQSVFGDDAPVG